MVTQWGPYRQEKFFKDLGLGGVWRKEAKKAFSRPYLITNMFDQIYTKQIGMLSDVIREIVRVECYLLEFERRRKSLMTTTLTELFVEKHERLVNSLKADGYALHEGEIIPLSLEELKEIRGALEAKLNKAGFTVALTHYNQAWENYVFSRWEAANAQLRSFVEAVFDDISLALYPGEGRETKSGGHRRQLLESKGFIENEKASLVKGFFEMAHTRGSHPGLSDEEDCRLRHAIATQLANYYLDKYLRA
ncbi:MAG: hypothetical protein ACE5JU_20370 [Candidatus Binatia bacterium]